MIVESAAIDSSFVPRPCSEVTTVELDGEAVLYDERTHTAHVLNGTAAVLWSCFDGSASLAEIIGDVADVYGAPAAMVEEDVVGLARRLGSQGLLDGVAGESDPAEDTPADAKADDCVDD